MYLSLYIFPAFGLSIESEFVNRNETRQIRIEIGFRFKIFANNDLMVINKWCQL